MHDQRDSHSTRLAKGLTRQTDRNVNTLVVAWEWWSWCMADKDTLSQRTAGVMDAR